MFLLESFEWLHRWHGRNEARRVADRSVGILLREDKRESRFGMQIEEKIIQFLFLESILIVKSPPPNIYWRESQGHTHCPCSNVTRR